MIQQLHYYVFSQRIQKYRFEEVHVPQCYSSIINNSQTMERAQMSINWQMDKGDYSIENSDWERLNQKKKKKKKKKTSFLQGVYIHIGRQGRYTMYLNNNKCNTSSIAIQVVCNKWLKWVQNKNYFYFMFMYLF